MCRLLGIVSSRPVDFRTLLADRQRSLAALGAEHRDGWGLAAWSGGRWRIHKGTKPAAEDARFLASARTLRGEVLVSHVRKGTVGATCRANTHPFARGRWVFAHNGTIDDRRWLAGQVSQARSDEVRGDTDSELFFAFLLTRLDEAGGEVDDALTAAAAACRARSGFGSLNFLVSDGATLWAHRFGRSLYLLERGGSRRARATFVASEPMTDEAWTELPNGALLRVAGTGEVTTSA